jgi:hypothetical protein
MNASRFQNGVLDQPGSHQVKDVAVQRLWRAEVGD